MSVQLIMLPILVPGVAGLAALVLPRRIRAALGLLGTLGTLAGGALLLRGHHAVFYEWTRLGPLNLDFALRADRFSAWAVTFIGLMSFLTALYSFGWFKGRDGAPGRHYAYFLLATAGAAGVLLSANLLLLVIFWEIVTLMLFFLVISGRAEAGAAAAKAFTIIGIGDMALLLSAVLMAYAHSAAGVERPLAMEALAANPIWTGNLLGAAIFILLLAGSASKAGAVPLHSWIPTISTATHPSVMGLLPASLDKVLGIYLLVRASLEWCSLSHGIRLAVMSIGVITILSAVLMAMVQHDLRRLLAFHAVSQVGYMVLGIGTGTIVGAMGGIFHMLNHAIYKPCLFLGAGMVEREAGTTELDRLGGLGRSMPVTFGAMFVAALAISGLPPMNGFVSKWLVYQGCAAARQPFFLVAALFGSMMTLASFVKVLHSIFWGSRPQALAAVRENGSSLRLPLIVLATLCILLGVFAVLPLDWAIGPALGLESGGTAVLAGSSWTWTSVAVKAEEAAYQAEGASLASFRPLALTGLLVLGIAAGLLLAFIGRMRLRRTCSVFIGGETIDPELNRFPGTDFYRTVLDVPLLGAALRQGEKGTFDIYRIGERLGGWIISGLRRLHSGSIDDYLMWCLLGLAVLLAVLYWI